MRHCLLLLSVAWFPYLQPANNISGRVEYSPWKIITKPLKYLLKVWCESFCVYVYVCVGVFCLLVCFGEIPTDISFWIDPSGTFYNFFKDLMTIHISKQWKSKVSKIQNCNDSFFRFSMKNVRACLKFVDDNHDGGKKGMFLEEIHIRLALYPHHGWSISTDAIISLGKNLLLLCDKNLLNICFLSIMYWLLIY